MSLGKWLWKRAWHTLKGVLPYGGFSAVRISFLIHNAEVAVVWHLMALSFSQGSGIDRRIKEVEKTMKSNGWCVKWSEVRANKHMELSLWCWWGFCYGIREWRWSKKPIEALQYSWSVNTSPCKPVNRKCCMCRKGILQTFVEGLWDCGASPKCGPLMFFLYLCWVLVYGKPAPTFCRHYC